jgi:hypothetical protein
MLNNLDTLLKSKKLEVEGLSLMHQADTARKGAPLSHEKEAAGAYRGLKEPEIQDIRTMWKSLITDPAVQKHIAEKEDPNAPEYISTVLAPHLNKLRPYILKLLAGIRTGIEDLVTSPSQKTLTLNTADRLISDIAPEMQQVLSSSKELTPFEMARLVTLRRNGVVESLLGMAEQLLVAYNEQDPTVRAKLLTMNSLLDEYTHRAAVSDSPHNRMVFASSMLDKLAEEIQAAGHEDLALELDKVSNELDTYC